MVNSPNSTGAYSNTASSSFQLHAQPERRAFDKFAEKSALFRYYIAF
ncbi:Uncharacterized protein {ECO:0000313/EMBL:ERM12537.1} [Pantoea ananatis]|nr:Uncharacterized protein {ECO:0000313/EMBL:ERM12537.1} [Pantoea ananatis]